MSLILSPERNERQARLDLHVHAGYDGGARKTYVAVAVLVLGGAEERREGGGEAALRNRPTNIAPSEWNWLESTKRALSYAMLPLDTELARFTNANVDLTARSFPLSSSSVHALLSLFFPCFRLRVIYTTSRSVEDVTRRNARFDAFVALGSRDTIRSFRSWASVIRHRKQLSRRCTGIRICVLVDEQVPNGWQVSTRSGRHRYRI